MCTTGVRLAVFDGAKKLASRAEEAYKDELDRRSDALYRLR